MILTKLVGYTKFDYTDKSTGIVTKKVQVCFEDTESIPEVGKIYSTFNFKADKVPDFKKDDIGKDIIVELGKMDGGRKYGSSIVFR